MLSTLEFGFSLFNECLDAFLKVYPCCLRNFRTIFLASSNRDPIRVTLLLTGLHSDGPIQSYGFSVEHAVFNNMSDQQGKFGSNVGIWIGDEGQCRCLEKKPGEKPLKGKSPGSKIPLSSSGKAGSSIRPKRGASLF